MRWRIVSPSLSLIAIATMASAQNFPLSYQVTGVDAADVLNIRANPSTNADILGTIGPYGISVEVLALSQDGKWGRVGLPEGNGWVAMRFLEETPAVDAYQIPRPLTCVGTEPFWSISLYPRGAEYNSPETGAVPLSVVSESVAPQGYMISLEEGPTLRRTLIITRELCHDGMSEREFGFSNRLFVESPDGNQVVSGCCTLDHR